MRFKLILSIVALGALLVLGIRIKGQSGSNTWTPYTITQREASSAEGKTDMRYVVHARRSDGSIARVDYQLNDPRTIRGRTVLLVPVHERISIDDMYRLTTTMVVELPQPTVPPPPDPSCGLSRIGAAVNPNIIGHLLILGYDTVGIKTDEGQYAHSSWKAPALGCVELRTSEDRIVADQVTGHFEKETTAITVSEPDAALFTVSNEYTEISPLAAAKAKAAREHRPEASCVTDAVLRAEKDYWRLRPGK